MTPAVNQLAGRRRLLWFSSVSNVLLLLVLGLSWLRQPGDGRQGEPDDPSNAATVGERPPELRSPQTRARGEAPGSPAPTPWSRLVSGDLREFAANLRGAGCPAETVCDVIRPESRRALEGQTAAARFHANFWMSGIQRADHNRQVRELVWQREREQLELFAELECLELWPEEEKEVEMNRIVSIVAGFLPPERQLALLDVVAGLQRFRERWQEQTEGVALPADLTRLAEESRRVSERIRLEVGAAEFEEVCLRVVALLNGGSGTDETLAALRVTPAEFRELHHRAYLAGENQAEQAFRLERLLEPDGNDRPSRTEPQREADDREVLGATRAAELHLRTSQSYASTRAWVDQYGLDPATPTVVFESLAGFRQEVTLLASIGRERPDPVKESFQSAYAQALARLERNLARVPATNRSEQIREWLQQAAQEGWKWP